MCKKPQGDSITGMCKEQHGSRETVARNKMRELVGSGKYSPFHPEWDGKSKRKQKR